MFKKIIIIVLFIGIVGVLVWGGVNRTMAKSESATGNHTGNLDRDHASEFDNETSGGRWGQRNQSQETDLFESQGRGGPNWDQNTLGEDASNYEYDHSYGVEGNLDRGSTIQSGWQGGGNGRGGNGRGSNGSRGNGSGTYQMLDENEIQALHMALDDEYHALAVYQTVIETFGQVEPFASIAQSEQRHIEALANQFNKNGIPIPENPWLGTIPTFESLDQACQSAAQAERENAELYEELFNLTDNPSLINVFTNLSRASLESHLPEFEACS